MRIKVFSCVRHLVSPRVFLQPQKHNISGDEDAELNNQSVLMELDTGAGISIISEGNYTKFFKGVPLEPSTTKLHAHTGDPIHVLGQFNVNAR